MMKSTHNLIVLIFALPFFLLSCTGAKKLTTDQTFLNLEPVEPLPIYDLEGIPDNFEVIIENVADMGSSYKNRAAFYVNDHLIVPDHEITNIQNKYVYHLKLQPGFYNIRGEYYALDGFAEKHYAIKPQTKVMVKPETLTKVYCRIEKNWDGTPLHDQMFFNVTYVPLKTTPREKKMMARENAPPPVPPPGRKITPPRRRGTQVLDLPPDGQLLTLQIKTAPAGADIYVDNEYVGKSPIRIMVDRNSDHLLEISKPGYEEVTKRLYKSQFGREKTIHLIQKLIRTYRRF